MVCGNRLKIKYVRFLIHYHLLIFISILIMSGACLSYLLTKHHQFDSKHLLRGFLAHGTTLSDDYRKFLALLRETQTKHFYPPSKDHQILSSTPYLNYQPEMNPCSKRYHHSQCPIMPYVELIFESYHNESFLFENIASLKNICQLEENIRMFYSNCSRNSSFCCEVIGPVGLLLNQTCNEITDDIYQIFFKQWQTCQSSCSNKDLKNYLLLSSTTSRRFTIYLSLENNRENIFQIYEDFLHYINKTTNIRCVDIHIKDGEEKNLLFVNLIKMNLHWILLTLICYSFCLILFVKNFFLIFTIFLHFLLSTSMALIVYRLFLQLPWNILNVTSLVLYLIILLIDSFLWYACWFNNNHRRDDCPIQRIIENLLTQAFFYLMPKNLTAIIALVITYTNQIIALQYFTVLSLFLITFSSIISFVLYPVSFVFILRYQSLIPTLEHCSIRCLTNAISCFIDRTIPYLIVRFKALWLTFLTLIFPLAMIIVFQWPKLEFNVCQMTFDSLPNQCQTSKYSMRKTFDIDITYYIGSAWEKPRESFIPINDIPELNYNIENRMSSMPDDFGTFSYALRTNLSEFRQFCSMWKESIQHRIIKRETKYKHYHRHILTTETNITSTTSSFQNTNDYLTIDSFPCFADSSRHPREISSSSQAKFSSIIHQHNQLNCHWNCSSNQTDDCIECLNELFYLSSTHDDLFLLKNGLRYLNNAKNPRYLLQTIKYRWNMKTNLNHFNEWKQLIQQLRTNFIEKFFSETFTNLHIWWTTESFGTLALMEELQKEKFLLITLKFVIILIFLTLFTGVLGIFVTLTTLLNFFTCLATLTLFNYSITVENMSYFVIVLIICSQYSVLYSISYKLAPTFFFQRENRTMYSLQQLCTTLFQVTFSIILLSCPCLLSSLPYLFKSACIYIISAVISLIYSTFFLQSLLCLIGPAGHSCCLTPCQFILTPNFTLHIRKRRKKDGSLRSASTSSGAVTGANSGSTGTRRHRHLSHPRMSTSSYFASSYFSQIFTSSTYFESDYGGLNDSLTIASRRRESSRSHQTSHAMKRTSLLTGELIELYTPRASLAPHAHNHRYSRQTSVPRAGAAATSMNSARPLYVSSSISPYSQLSIHSQIPSRQRSPSPQVFHPSRSPSPRPPFISQLTSPSSLRPCYSAPRLHVPLHRMQTTAANITQYSDKTTTLIEETSPSERPVPTHRKTVMIMQRQDAISCSDEIEPMLNTTPPTLTAAIRRNMLKTTTFDSAGPVWLKRSSSS